MQNQPNLSDTIIVVSGLPRSGTSMMMSMLQAGGIELLKDEIRTPDDDNPKGYYEFERVKKLKEGDVDWLEGAQGKAVKIISQLLLHLPETFTYNVLFMHRKIPEILASQRKMLTNRGKDPNQISDEELEPILKKHLDHVDEWLKNQPNIQRIDVDYNEMLENPDDGIEQVNQFLGYTLDTQKMAQVIDPELYRQRK
ncbi:MAG: sulfotransferase family protein [Anaerolineales bacterium]|nr:sulfotransferase family protein [Anaerolineales bacterium]